jgi:Tol biopolymer transport system component
MPLVFDLRGDMLSLRTVISVSRISRVLGVLVAASLIVPAYATATFPGKPGLIAFHANTDANSGRSAVFTVQSDGSNVQQIGPVGASSPSWSPSGRQLAFDAPVGSEGARGVVVTSVAGREAVVAPEGVDPAFSPSGDRVAYSTADGLETKPLSGGRARLLVEGRTYHAEYSPAGRWIIFMGVPKGASKGGLWIVRTNGEGLRHLRGGYRPGSYASFSPDGRRIVFAKQREVWTLRLDGSHLQRIGPGRRDPVISPSGTHYATLERFVTQTSPAR